MTKLILSAVLAACLAYTAAAIPDPRCAAIPFFLPDGTNVPGAADWSSVGPTTAFRAGPCLQLAGIGMTETRLKTILIIDRSGARNGPLILPGKPDDPAFAAEVNLLTGEQRALNVITNSFCSSGQHMPDGRFLSIGGMGGSDYAGDGSFSIRAFTPCLDGTCDFSIAAQMAEPRWYPTTCLLPDGRLMVVGGATQGVGLNKPGTNVPFIEYYPKAAGETAHDFPFLTDALPYNLFPFVHLLPSGKVFIFAGNIWTLWDTLKNAAVEGDYPPINAVDAAGKDIRLSYPLSATAAMFPLTPFNNYQAEIMVCGGGSVGFLAADGTTMNNAYPTSAQCFRILPEAAKPAWVNEAPMKLPRVASVAVLLPDGNLLIVGGTQEGYAALGNSAHKPALTPELYNTATHEWYAGKLATSHVPRSYHTSAVMLHDSSVFISGSNPNSNWPKPYQEGDFPTEFRSEYFHPPYMAQGLPQPVLVNAPPSATYGTPLPIVFTFDKPIKKLSVVLAQPGFSTHGANHGMRNVVLTLKPGLKVVGANHVVTAVMPVNKNLLPPTWYWLFVVVNGVPNKEGHAVVVTKEVA